ncbi:MAG: MBL fold metallo-hydrolase, partial [Proteobacteria bacterium]|nr:MBL fold metallo-hydrolase [Pseudomonadota bacterium]
MGLMLPAAWRFDRAALRIDMLAVGDGTCLVVRSGSSTVLFDAGSSSDRAVARRVIVPALRRLGVRSIDALVVSHPNLDHYAAALELADAFMIREVLITPQLFREARRDPYGAVMFLLGGFADRSVRVVEVAAGEHRDFGLCRWSWLHPVGTETYGKLNDGSMVIRIEVAGRSVLLCGDIQRAAIDALGQLPAADIVELPHHGSLDTRAEAFVAGLDPTVVVGGKVNTLGSNARLGQGESRFVVLDEGDLEMLDASLRAGKMIGVFACRTTGQHGPTPPYRQIHWNIAVNLARA